MTIRKRFTALVLTGMLAAALAGGYAINRADNAPTPNVPHVGDTVDGQVIFQVERDGSFMTAPDVPCTHEDGSGQELPCVWRANQRGNLQGESYIIMPGGDDGRIVYFDR